MADGSRESGRPPKRRRSDATTSSGPARDWGNLPLDIVENIVSRIESFKSTAIAFRYYGQWSEALLTAPRPTVLSPLPLPQGEGRSDLLVPASIWPQGAFMSRSSLSNRGFSFRYMTVPGFRVPHTVRLIGGTAAVLLFVDDERRTIITYCLSRRPPGADAHLQISVELPDALIPEMIYMGSLVLSRTDNYSLLPGPEYSTRGLLVLTSVGIFHCPVTAVGEIGPWGHMLPLPVQQTQIQFRFTSVLPSTGVIYLLDSTHRLFTIRFNSLGQMLLNQLDINRVRLMELAREQKILAVPPAPQGWCELDGPIICLRYEYSRPRYYRFAAYELVLQNRGRSWRALNELCDWCIFIGWGSGAQAFAYHYPERFGLRSGRVYDTQAGLRSYRLNQLYTDRDIAPSAPVMWPFPIWIHPWFLIQADEARHDAQESMDKGAKGST